MIDRRTFLTGLGLAAIAGCRELPKVSTAASPLCWSEGAAPRTIAIVGDTQRTGLLERGLLGRRQNDEERETVLRAIAGERPDMLLMLGDQVVAGDDSDWEYFDQIIAPVRAAEIPTMALLGNHDYDGEDPRRSVANFCERFPHQRGKIHGLVRLGDLALVTLDSNFDRLSERDIERSTRRYQLTLDTLDADPSVRTVIVASHHPPYTNSDLSGGADLARVEALFARPFHAARKTRLYLSGHVHSYERFEIGGKTFVVSGGGGGPRREVDNGPDRPYHNDVYRQGRLRPFHYLLAHIDADRITLEVKMLRRGHRWAFDLGDRAELAA